MYKIVQFFGKNTCPIIVRYLQRNPTLADFSVFGPGRHIVIREALPKLALMRIEYTQEIIEPHDFLVSYCVAPVIAKKIFLRAMTVTQEGKDQATVPFPLGEYRDLEMCGVAMRWVENIVRRVQSAPMDKVLDRHHLRRDNKTSGGPSAGILVLVAWGVYRGYSVIPKSVQESRIISNFKQVVFTEEDYEKVTAIGVGNFERVEEGWFICHVQPRIKQFFKFPMVLNDAIASTGMLAGNWGRSR
ncbi:hypothetical protein EDD22DRAFT_849808 [Suillus occidentalis]|nr:hypothetical protein EDD22DRAFT_849808 [Suillus occidentalis]